MRLIKIDARKYLHNRTFWVFSALYAIMVVLVFTGMESFLNHVVSRVGGKTQTAIPTFSLYAFPYVWHNLAFIAGLFKIFLALLVIIFITNEFNYKTIRQNIMSGMSRVEFLFSKVLFVLIISLTVTLILLFSALFLGLTHTEHLSASLLFSKIYFVPVYFLEIFTFLLFALMVAFLLQKQGLSIGLFALYYYVAEPLFAFRLPAEVSRYLPIKMITHLIDVPNSSLMRLFGVNFRETVSGIDIAGNIIYALLFVFIVYRYLKNKDL